MKIEVILTAEIFRRFTLYDTLNRRQAWKSPVIFASILSVCAVICYIMHHIDGAILLGTVLLVVGLGMPGAYFLSFFLSISDQIKSLGLNQYPKHIYTVTLTEDSDGIQVENEKEQTKYKWKQVHHAYRNTLDTYLYITPQRGFILPDTCVEDPDKLWQLLVKKLGTERCTDLRK